MRRGIVIIKTSFNIEKNQACFPVAHRHLKRCIRWEFFDDELVQGRLQWLRKAGGVSRYEPHRARLRTAQDIVKDKNREKRIGAHLESQGLPFRFLCPGS